MTLTLKTVSQSEHGTFGVLIPEGQPPFALTLEPPWRNNEPNRSCIPAGRYRCRRVDSPHFGVTFEITEVAGRTHVLFHKGNTVEDTHGCVLIGEEFAGASVASSKRGFDEFMALMNGREEFWLVVLRDEGG